MENEDLILKLRSGDEAAFDSVYRAYFKGLCSFAAQYVSYEEAYELVQGTMLWLWEKRSSLIPGMSLKSLLFTIVKNKALNSISHNYVQDRIHRAIIEKYDSRLSDPDLYLENELFALFAEALDKLPERTRVIFEMNRMDGMTHVQIAEQLNITRHTVNYHITTALKILRGELRDYLPILLFLILIS